MFIPGNKLSQVRNLSTLPTMNGQLPDPQADAPDFEQPFHDAYLAQHTFDATRIAVLQQAIVKAVNPGDIVADLGSGQGFLALFAAKAGAKKVYCVEIEESHAKYIKWLAELNGVADKLVVLNEDAKSYELPEPVDVLICELVSAGFYYEPQIQVMNHNLNKLKPGGRVVPEAMENSVQLIHADDNLYGVHLPPVTRWTGLEGDQTLTEAALYHKVDFYTHNDTHVSATVELTATVDGTANAIRVLPDIWTRQSKPNEPGIHQNTASPSWGNPQIVWLKQPLALEKGQTYTLTIDYTAGNHPDMSTLTVTPATKSQPAAVFDTWSDFDPVEYVNRNYDKILSADQLIIKKVIAGLRDMDLPRLRRVADVGAGPNFYPAMLLASLIEPDGHIDLIEYSGTNRRFMQTLLGDGDGIFYNKNKAGVAQEIDTREPWQKFETFIAQFGMEPRFRHTFSKARRAAKSVAGDVYWLPEAAYDFVSSYFVPESITISKIEYSIAVNSLLGAVRPNGGFMMAFMIGSAGWPAGEGTQFPAVDLSFTDVQEMFEAIPGIEAETTYVEDEHEKARPGYHGMSIVIGRKVPWPSQRTF